MKRKDYTFQNLLMFVWRADTDEKVKIAKKWLYEHIEDENDYKYLIHELAGQQLRNKLGLGLETRLANSKRCWVVLDEKRKEAV